MAFNFPDVPDVQFDNAPLAQVICQIRFPPILRIANEVPSTFQDRVRSEFPDFEQELGLAIHIPELGSADLPEAKPSAKTYRFWSHDKQTSISLALNFYALSTTHYTHWENFVRHLSLTHEAVQMVYQPSYATRIGLRYVNRFTPENTPYQSLSEIINLLRPELTAQTRSDVWDSPLEMRSRLLLSDDSVKLALGTHYGLDQNSPFFVLDFDCFEEDQFPIPEIIDRCTHYNQIIYRAFHWSICDEKRTILNPKPKKG